MNPVQQALSLAIAEARRFEGATAPNPPVGAAALDSSGNILSIQAHERAGTPHAEAKVIADCNARGILSQVETLVVTLEPCNHFGKTPPCTEAIKSAGIRRVIFGTKDPNPKVVGAGAQALRDAGVEVIELDDPECAKLIRAFSKVARTGLPWITIKTAHDRNGSMIPPQGTKTFTSKSSLVLAHELRRRADAILTGSGTVIADQPEFTVRMVQDHNNKMRHLVVLDRRGRTPPEWVNTAESRGFKVSIAGDLSAALKSLSEAGVLEVLVEAGPTLSQAILQSGAWDEHVIVSQDPLGGPDRVETRLNA